MADEPAQRAEPETPLDKVLGAGLSKILFTVVLALFVVNFISEELKSRETPKNPPNVPAKKCGDRYIDRFQCYVRDLANNVAAFDPTSVERSFNSQLRYCHYGWNLECEPIQTAQASAPAEPDGWHALDCEQKVEAMLSFCNNARITDLDSCKEARLGVYTPPGCVDWANWKLERWQRIGELPLRPRPPSRQPWNGFHNTLESIRGIPSASYHAAGEALSQGHWPALVVLLITMLATWSILLHVTDGNPFSATVLAFFVGPLLMSGNAWLISRVMRAMMWLFWGVASLLILALWLAELLHLFVSALEVARSPHEVGALVKKSRA